MQRSIVPSNAYSIPLLGLQIPGARVRLIDQLKVRGLHADSDPVTSIEQGQRCLG